MHSTHTEFQSTSEEQLVFGNEQQTIMLQMAERSEEVLARRNVNTSYEVDYNVTPIIIPLFGGSMKFCAIGFEGFFVCISFSIDSETKSIHLTYHETDNMLFSINF